VKLLLVFKVNDSLKDLPESNN